MPPSARNACVVGADACIGPPTGLAGGCLFRVISRSRPQCRAGVFARRLGFAASQGLRDDASIVPYGRGARPCQGLQDTCGAKRQCTPPSAPCGASTSPCRGGFGGLPPYKASPVRGGIAPGDGGVRHPCPASILPGCRLSLPPRTRVGQCPLRRLLRPNHRGRVSPAAMRPPAFYPSRASSRTQMLRSSGGCAAGKQHRR